MAQYDAELLSGSIGAAARELKMACLEEFDRWAKHAPADAEGMAFNDDRRAAEHALYEVRTYLDDYLAQSLAVVLASWGLTASNSDGDVVWRCVGNHWFPGDPAQCQAAPGHREKCGWVRITALDRGER